MKNKLLSIKQVKKRYKKGNKPPVEALRGVSFDIEEGEIFALLGVNGSGKTTLSSIIASLIPATCGDVLWRGCSIYKQLMAYRQIVGFCPQKPNIDPLLTLDQNLLFAGRFFGMKEIDINRQKGHLIEMLELEDYREARVSILSGGYKQRFLIARSLIHSPKLVILDEPTVGLDPHIRHELWKIIRCLREEKVTVILTTHYLEEAEALADRVCMIDLGDIKTLDTPEQIKLSYNKDKLEDVLLAIRKERE